MSRNSPILDDLFIGEDKNLVYTITTGDPIRLTASINNGDATIQVEPITEDIADEANILFIDGFQVEVDGAHDAYSTSIAIVPAVGALYIRQSNVNSGIGFAAQSLSGWTLEWIMRKTPGGAAVLTIANAAITKSGAVATVPIADTDTDALTPGEYFYVLRRTNAGSESILAHGKIILRAA